MTATLMDGVAAARRVYADLAPRVAALKAKGIVPGLATVLVGDDPASAVYVRNKIKACREAGMLSEDLHLPASCSQAELLATVAALNTNAAIHGIIVQLPLPKHLDPNPVVQAIAAHKDVDGFHRTNLGALVAGEIVLAPGTPLGILRLLDDYGITIDGRHAVVVGRGPTVGRPLALMLIARGATVTVCNSRTPDLASFTRRADILIAATGKAGLITGEMVKPGAAVVDVGISRLPSGKITGDVDFASAKEVAAHISPVPGGVGPMTVSMLIANTVLAAERGTRNP